MEDFIIRVISYAVSFALIIGVIALIRQNMKKKSPKLVGLSVEELGVEFAVVQLAYSGLMIIIMILCSLFLVATIGLIFLSILPTDAAIPIGLALAACIIISIIWLSLPGVKLAAQAGPNYGAMRRYYAENQKECISLALKDSRVISAQKSVGKLLGKVIIKMVSSKALSS